MGDYQFTPEFIAYVRSFDTAAADAIAALTRERDEAIKTNNNLAIENIRLSSECETLRHVCEVSSGTQYTLEATEEKLDFAKLEIDRLMQDVATERHSASVSDEVCVAEMQARKEAEAARDAAIARAEAAEDEKSEWVKNTHAKAETCTMLLRHADALRALLREAELVIQLLLNTPEIADCDPRDKDNETQIAERKARNLAARIAAAMQTGGEDD